jgi:predicted small lipoprotein YifL
MNTMASILGRRLAKRGLAQGLALIMTGYLLAACGQKGPLYLPDSRNAVPAPAAPADELTPGDPPTPGR